MPSLDTHSMDNDAKSEPGSLEFVDDVLATVRLQARHEPHAEGQRWERYGAVLVENSFFGELSSDLFLTLGSFPKKVIGVDILDYDTILAPLSMDLHLHQHADPDLVLDLKRITGVAEPLLDLRAYALEEDCID